MGLIGVGVGGGVCFGDATFSSFGGGGGGGEMRLVSMEAELEVREGTEESGGGAAAAAAESAGEGGADEIGATIQTTRQS